MANRWAVANGNYSAAATWNDPGGGATVPASGDDVYSNTYTVQLDVDVTANTLRNTANAGIGVSSGGGFAYTGSTNRSVTATNGFYNTGTTGVLIIVITSPGIVTISGDLNSGTAGRWFTFSGTGTINWTGNLANGWAGVYNGGAIYSTNTGTVNITGNLNPGTYFAASTQFNNWAYSNASTGTVNITGLVYGNSYGYAVYNASTGRVNIIGTAMSGPLATAYAVYSTTAGIVQVTGIVDTQVPPTTVTPAIYLTTGTLYFSGIAINRSERPVIDVTKMVLLSTASTTWTFQDSGVGFKNLYTADLPALGNPLPANVRKNISYGPVGELSGTAYMPTAPSVLLNVPFDVASFGTLLMTPADFWAELLTNITTPNSIGMRLKDCATVDSTGTQIASLT